MRRSLVFLLAMLTAALLQTTVFSQLTLFGVAPDLILVSVICLAMLEGPSTGAVAGFWGGLLRDLLLDSPKGLTGLSYLVVGYAVGTVRPYLQTTSVLVPVAGIFAGSLVGSALFEVLQALLGQQQLPFDHQLRVVGLTAIYNTLLTPFVYPLVKRISGAYKREKVYRW